jgi:hypothetical protein
MHILDGRDQPATRKETRNRRYNIHIYIALSSTLPPPPKKKTINIIQPQKPLF